MSLSETLVIRRVDFPAAATVAEKADAAANAAALRQFTPLRLSAYGVEPGDALRLMELVEQGGSWRRSALALASMVLDRLEDTDARLSTLSAAELHSRASALQRISQVMEVDNTPERRAVYAQAVENFAAARRHDDRYERVLIDTCHGQLAAWVITPRGDGPFPVVLVHGGVDGWSMDWEGLALTLVGEGMTAVVIDGPGQGESRFTHGHYLTPDWLEAYEQVCEFLVQRAAGEPIGAVGNSMAAGIVAMVASRYPVFSAVCSNGPVTSMAALLERKTYARKLAAFCAEGATDAEVFAVFESMELTEDKLALECPFLLLQGSADPMVPVEHGMDLLRSIRSADKQMVLFEGGEHVINRYPADKHHVIRTWMRQRLDTAAAR